MLPFKKEIEISFADGENVGLPQPEVLALGELATFIVPGEVGKESVKLIPVILALVGLVMVNVSTEVPFGLVESGEKSLAMLT